MTPKLAAKLRILDPACGSGSFLVRAYQYLLDWHRDWYAADDPAKHPKELYQGKGGQWLLSTREKKRILLNNIYGVDIDAQAVEVTKLSLLLKVLEHENQETLGRQMLLAHERALPDLGNNIKCGNSLIGPDFYDGQQASFLDEEEKYRINVFDWHAEFPQIMKAGGFDAVIGNPPWVSAWTGEDQDREYLVRKFDGLGGHWDLYLAFLLQSLKVMGPQGVQAFVYPTSIMTEPYAKVIRRRLIEGQRLARLAVFGAKRVFSKVSRKVCILVLQPNLGTSKTIVDRWESGKMVGSATIDSVAWLSTHNNIFSLDTSEIDLRIHEKIKEQCIRVGDVYYVNYGAQISSKEKGAFSQDKLLGMTKKGNAKKCLRGANVKRYRIEWEGLFLDYQAKIMYGPRHPCFFESPKIIVNKTSTKGYGLIATYDDAGYYCDQRLICLVRYNRLDETSLKLDFTGFQRTTSAESALYHTGLMNSGLMSYWFRSFVATKNLQGDYTDVLPKMVRSLPIRRIDFSSPADKSRHDQLVALVEQMLALYRQLAAAKTPDERTRLERQIAATDQRIDRLVYDLYGLTEEEIKIVEGPNQA